jgi:SAM-dependent methyltransferase
MTELRDAVRERYAERALEIATGGSGCCDTGCCDDISDASACGYTAADLASVGFDPKASLGCGNPLLLADLHPGEQILDLGSGMGLDVLLSAKRVSPGGHAYGVDMTDEMLEQAREHQRAAGIANATFLKGTIEEVPLPDAAVDVVISNCVINLAADKSAVLREAYRVLRPGGRFAVADMVALHEISPFLKRQLDLWAGCVAGTITVAAYRDALSTAGFTEVDVEITREIGIEGVTEKIASAYIRARKPAAA